MLGFATTDEIGSVMDMTKRRKTKTITIRRGVQGGKLKNAGKFRAQRRDHDDGDGGGRAFIRLLHPSSAGG